MKYKLLIAGSKKSEKYYKKITDEIAFNDASEYVVLLGAVDKQKLLELYTKCELLFYTSPCESAGYTLVEAMSCGSSILCSNMTAAPETCNKAALYFDPFDIVDMTDKLGYLLDRPNELSAMSKKSLRRVDDLPSYVEASHETLDILKKLIKIK